MSRIGLCQQNYCTFLPVMFNTLHSAQSSIHMFVCFCRGTDEAPDDPNATVLPHPVESDPLRQRFSITTHPRFPLIVCSDGYMVTVLQVMNKLLSDTFTFYLSLSKCYQIG